MKWVVLAAGAALASASLASAASAGVVYSNGVLDGNTNGWSISFAQAIGDSFVLASDTTVTGVNFGVWSATGATMSTIDWGITSTPNVVALNGTAAVTSGAVTDTSQGFVGGPFYDIRTDSFSTGGLFLTAGTYYLWLQNASPPGDIGFYWDMNNGPSVAYWSPGAGIVNPLDGQNRPGTNSDFFQILDGGASGAPEPAAWAMMLVGFGGLGAAMRLRRKALGAALTA
jgi:hypothetical protein